MKIQFRTQPAPTIPDHIAEALAEMTPECFLIWNPRVYQRMDKTLDDGSNPWEGRWEIWIELENSRHDDAKNIRQESDRWNTDKQCWMRKLQSYETADKEYAPLDWGLIIGLEMADTWKNRLFYEDNILAPEEAENLAAEARQNDILKGVINYYHNYNKTQVGAAVSSGWRHRIR